MPVVHEPPGHGQTEMEEIVDRARLEGVASRLLGVSGRLGDQGERIYLAACWVASACSHHPYQDIDRFELPEVADTGDIMEELVQSLVEINTAMVPVTRHPLLEQASVHIQETIYMIKRRSK